MHGRDQRRTMGSRPAFASRRLGQMFTPGLPQPPKARKNVRTWLAYHSTWHVRDLMGRRPSFAFATIGAQTDTDLPTVLFAPAGIISRTLPARVTARRLRSLGHALPRSDHRRGRSSSGRLR